MTDPALLPPPPGRAPGEPDPRLENSAWQRRGAPVGAWVAWSVVILVTVSIPIMHALRPAAPLPVGIEAPAVGPDVQLTVMGKYVVAAGRVTPAARPQLLEQMATQARMPEQRVAHAVVVGEFEGAPAAAKVLDQAQGPAADDFRAFYTSGQALPDEVAQRYGFFARLAQVQGEPDEDPVRAGVLREAQQTFLVMAGAGMTLIVGLIAGTGLLVTAIVLLWTGTMQWRMTPPTAPARVYIEAFAVYLGGFVAGSLIVQALAPEASMAMRALPLVGAFLLGMAWPVVRGVAWSQQRLDWGIHAGRNGALEVLAGIGGYIAGLPIIAIGFLITVLLLRLSGTTATHPISEQIAGNPLPLFLLAAVFAPVTEELMFRGALLSHLRGRLGVIVSSLIVGLIFAAVHPQGWAAIPVLGAVGFVLAGIRQWRGSLIAPMAAHAFNNATVLLLVILMA